jgi:hypothetical protein
MALTAMVHAEPAPSTTVERIGDGIVFRGRIEAVSAAKFLELLREPGITRVVITSRGGRVDAALDMAEAIAEQGLDVEVPRACLSSCANYVFPAGRRKRLGHARAVGWHGNMTHVLHLAQTGQASWTEPQMQDARRLARREQAFFRRVGVDGFVCWFGKIPPHNVDEFYALVPQDMARFGIADVTVGDGAAAAGAPELITVDWERIGGHRPAVALDTP